MRIKFNYFERIAGLFVIVALALSIASTIGIGIKRGWFSAKVPLVAHLPSAEGIYVGTRVQMSGLHAGEVDEVNLLANNNVQIVIAVKEKFFSRLKTDSVLRVVRPFVIGEKMVDLSAGTEQGQPLAPNAVIQVEPSGDLMELLSGKSMGSNMAILSKLSDNLRKIAEAMADPKRGDQFVEILDQIPEMMKSLQELTHHATALTRKLNRNDNVDKIIANTAVLTHELTKILPALNENSPTLGKDMAHMATDLSKLTNEFAKLVPMIEQMTPNLPKASGRALEALDETVVTLKAIQKSFLLRSAAKEVREEEKKKEQKSADVDVRAPAEKSN